MKSRPHAGLWMAGMVALLLFAVGCPKVAHKELPEEQVGLAALREDNVKRVILGEEIQGYVSQYPLFAEVVNTEILRDVGGYVQKYNVYARERIKYPETGLSDLDPFLQRATRAAATVRVGTRLMNYIGKRLTRLKDPDAAAPDSDDVYYSMTPEAFSLAVQAIRDVKGTLSGHQKRELARDIVALAADMEAVSDAVEQARGLQVEGANLKRLVTSRSFAAELEARDAGRAKLLPEIISNLNGALAALGAAESDGSAVTRNARAWKIYLADAMQ